MAESALDWIWLWLDRLTIVVAALAAVLSAMAWCKSKYLWTENLLAEQKRRAPITIRLSNGGRLLELPYRPRRDQLSRQELAGLLGLYYGESRFDPCIVRRVLENGALNRVLAGDDRESSRDELLVLEVEPVFFDRVQENLGFPDKICVSRSELAPSPRHGQGRQIVSPYAVRS